MELRLYLPRKPLGKIPRPVKLMTQKRPINDQAEGCYRGNGEAPAKRPGLQRAGPQKTESTVRYGGSHLQTSTWKIEIGNYQKFKVSLGYIVRP